MLSNSPKSVLQAVRKEFITKKSIVAVILIVWILFSGFFSGLTKNDADVSEFIDTEMIEAFDQSFSGEEIAETMKSLDYIGNDIATQTKANFSSNYEEIDPEVIVEMKEEGLMKNIIGIIIDYIFK